MSNTANANFNTEWYYPFLINGNVTIRSFTKYIGSLTTIGTGKHYGAIYKYDKSTADLNLIVAQPTEFDYLSGSGATGWQVVNLTAPVDLTAGVYFMRGICSSSGSNSFRYYNTKSLISGMSTTSIGANYGFSRFSIPYDFGSTPSTIPFSVLQPSSSFYVPAHAFYCEIG